MKMAVPENAINLLKGWPSRYLLPVKLVSEAAQKALAKPEVAIPGMSYGPDPGFEPLREALATWLTQFYQPSRPIHAENITISGGASQSLGCILQAFTDPLYTRNVWIIAPAYYLAMPIFQDAGFQYHMRSVRELPDGGVDLSWLREEVRKVEKQRHEDGTGNQRAKSPKIYPKIYRHVIYSVPTFSNPTSTVMNLEAREELVRFAREVDALIIADDVYDMLQWPVDGKVPADGLQTRLLPRLFDIDCAVDGGIERAGADGWGNAISNGSFSKICGPGCRSGWVNAGADFSYRLSQAGTTRSGGAASQLTATFMTELVTSGQLQRHIYRTLQPAYAKRYTTMTQAIQEYLVPLGVKLHRPITDVIGGYFVWLTLPTNITSGVLAKRALEQEQVTLSEGTEFEIPGDYYGLKFDNCIRLSFSWEDVDRLEEGVQRLARVIQRMQQ